MDKLSRFMDMLERYREQAQTLSVYELLRLIYQETGYYHIMSAMPAGEKRGANLDLLLQRALEYVQKGNYGIFSFVRYIESLKKAEIDFGEASLTNENTNAVRIMSIHKSKGLEFPVVFLAGLAKGINQTDARGTVRDSDYGLGVDFVDLERRYKRSMVFKNFLADRSKRNTLAEELRILYVALTRAKELLILTGTVDDPEKQREKWERTPSDYSLLELTSAKKYMDWIMPLAARKEAEQYFEIEEWDAERLTGQAARELAEDILKQSDLLAWDTGICYEADLRRELEEQEQFEYPFEAERGIPVKISVSELKRLEQQRGQQAEEELWQEEKLFSYAAPEQKQEKSERGTAAAKESGKELPRPAFLSGDRELTGAERGTLYHLVFEHLPYGRLGAESSEGEIAKWLEEMKQNGYISEQERQVIQPERITAFLQSRIGCRMAAAAKAQVLHREQQFIVGKPANTLYPDCKSEEPVLVQGIIDAWFPEGEEIVLVDYKTDFVRNGLEELAEKYRIQLAYYAEALERMTGYRVGERVIYSVALGESIVIH